MTLPSARLRSFRLAVRALLVAFALFWFVFALLSGAARHGEGIGGVLGNLPNAVPWLVLFAIVYIAFRWELAGGILIVLAGMASMMFFDVLASPAVLLAVSVPLLVLGGGLVLCWALSRPQRL